jgi:NAD(P)H-dependent FMN reductase
MTSRKNILAICGSTRQHSANKDVINAIAELAKDTLNIIIYEDLTALPYFNQDLSIDNTPQSVVDFRKAINKADGVLICTPEYVFSLPGILKNAIEWTVSTTIFADKPTALITASSSGQKAHESLLLIMNTLSIKTNEDMCLLISGVKSKLNSQGQFIDEASLTQLKQLIKHL